MGTSDKIQVGQKIGKWTIIKKDDSKKYKTRDSRWICKCECGLEKSVLQKYLLNGKSISCGCDRKVKLDGQKFGYLTVLETIYGYNGYNRATYKCACDCGNITYVKSTAIYHTNSCGKCNIKLEKQEIGKKYGKLTVKKILPKYRNNNTYCECLCECGNDHYITKLNGLHIGNTQSCGCIHSPNLIGEKFGRLTVIDTTVNDQGQKVWKCKCDCGNLSSIYVKSYQLTSGHTQSCGCLRSKNVSIGETIIAEYLNERHILYEKEKTFPDCVGIGRKKLRYDFYLPVQNVCIEYNGLQHDMPIDYFGGTESFIMRQKNDNIKIDYCKQHNINLHIIPYTQNKDIIIQNVNNIIQNPVTITA